MNDYGDNPVDARRLLRDHADAHGIDPDDVALATARPDPAVRHCWMVTLPDGQAFVVYTSGHYIPVMRNTVEAW